MRVSVDNERCEAHGQCAAVDEDFFTLDDDGYSNIGKGKLVPEGKEDLAREGVGACPMAALSVDDD
ncbi:MAG: ferredoxin [Jatrophihabitans sp.]